MNFRTPPVPPAAAAEEDRKRTALDSILDRFSVEALYQRSLKEQSRWIPRTIRPARPRDGLFTLLRSEPLSFTDEALAAASTQPTFLGSFPMAPEAAYELPTRAFMSMRPNAPVEWPYVSANIALRDLVPPESPDQLLERFGFPTIWPGAWFPMVEPADTSRLEIRAAALERRLRRHPDLVARLTDAHEALTKLSWLVPTSWPGLLEWANSDRQLDIAKLETRLQRWIDDEIVNVARALHDRVRTPATKYAIDVAIAHQEKPRVALPAWILATEVLIRDATGDPAYEIFARTKQRLAGDRFAHLIGALGLRRRKADLDAAVSILDRASRSTFELDPSFASRHAIAHPTSMEPVTDANARRWALLYMHFGELAVARLAA